jgi:hypothetical protein
VAEDFKTAVETMRWIRVPGMIAASLVLAAGSVCAQQRPETVVFNRCPELARVLESPAGMSSMLNPVLRTPAEIAAAVAARRGILACMNALRYQTVLPTWFASVRESLELFALFASDPDEAELVDLAATDDAGVRRLREDVGLPTPEGVVFVRYFAGRDALPAVLAPAFDSPETRAVTIGGRFVAILTRSDLGRPALRTGLARTLSHELVHTYLSAGLDWSEGPPTFPSWFQEGMAIYFSGSGQTDIGVGFGGGLVRVSPTAEYAYYERAFLYLEDTLGREAFYRAIRESVSAGDATVLLRAAGVDSYPDLDRNAGLWLRWWPIPPAMVEGPWAWVGLSLVLVGVIVAVRAWRRWQPAVPNSSLEVGLNADLLAAVQNGDAMGVSDLLRSGADPNARDRWGCLVLVRAVRAGRADLVERLIDGGARVDAHVRQAAFEAGDDDIDRLVADARTRWREVW